MIEVNSFAELRTTAPSASGVVAKLNRYYDKDSTFRGGGNFVGFIGTTTSTDDGGTLAVGSGFYWKRTINDPTEVNILHFGAKGDGTTDDTDAFKRMLTWTQGWNASCKDLPVRFPGGKFLIKPIDISGTEVAFFGLIGDDLELGSLPRTTIISDKTSSTVFKVKARRTHIKGIAWNGQCTADATTTPSTTAGSPVNMTGTGKTWINLQRLDTVWADTCHMGSPAVQDIRYSRVGTTYAVVWVKLAANSGDTMFTLRNTGPTRFDAGSCSLFQPDFSVVSDTTKLGSLKPAARFGMHNGLAGIGANEKGVLTLASAVGTPTDKTTPTGFVLVNINGVDHKVPYYD